MIKYQLNYCTFKNRRLTVYNDQIFNLHDSGKSNRLVGASFLF